MSNNNGFYFIIAGCGTAFLYDYTAPCWSSNILLPKRHVPMIVIFFVNGAKLKMSSLNHVFVVITLTHFQNQSPLIQETLAWIYH